jgi:hypothetical protein
MRREAAWNRFQWTRKGQDRLYVSPNPHSVPQRAILILTSSCSLPSSVEFVAAQCRISSRSSPQLLYACIYLSPYTFLDVWMRSNGWDTGSTDFGCSETKKEHPLENFSCQDTIYSSLLDQTLDHPVGEKFVYSDLRCVICLEAFPPFLTV